jgi:HAMP domain-containing protein
MSPSASETRPVPKISYVRLYEPWGWILGSGVYVDDVEKDMERLRSALLAGTVVFSAFTMAFTAFVAAGITRPLRKVIDGLQDIARGKGNIALNKRIAITTIDEIGLLSSEFNGVMESIGSLTAFKKVIDEDDSVLDVYRRLGDVFSEHFGAGSCRVYEVIGEENKLAQVYPLEAAATALKCDPEVEESCELLHGEEDGPRDLVALIPRHLPMVPRRPGRGALLLPAGHRRWDRRDRSARVQAGRRLLGRRLTGGAASAAPKMTAGSGAPHRRCAFLGARSTWALSWSSRRCGTARLRRGCGSSARSSA